MLNESKGREREMAPKGESDPLDRGLPPMETTTAP